jgi:DNA-directed RNA polymerase subunit E'/Rpb7
MAAVFSNDNMTAFVNRYSEDVRLEAFITVPPHQLRYNLGFVVRDRLARTIKNRCTEKDGFVLNLKQIAEIRGGVLDKRSGSVHYVVDYIAQTLRPNVGDVIEAVVSRVFKIGFFADLGPLNIFIPLSRLPVAYRFIVGGTNAFSIPGDPTKDIRPGTVVHIKLEKIAMLDDNFLPSNSTRCVLKAMGELVGAQASFATVAKSALTTRKS